MKRIALQKSLTTLVCAGIGALLLTATSSMAQVFLPDQTFLLQISTDENPGFGGTGHPNSITPFGLNAVDYNVTFGATGDTKVVVDRTSFGPNLNLALFTGTTVNTEVISGGASVQLFLQDGTAGFNFVNASGPGQTPGSGVLPLTYTFAAPFDPSVIIRYGLQFFGTAGQTATIRISTTPVPEPSSLALCALGAVSGAAFLRRRKA